MSFLRRLRSSSAAAGFVVGAFVTFAMHVALVTTAYGWLPQETTVRVVVYLLSTGVPLVGITWWAVAGIAKDLREES